MSLDDAIDVGPVVCKGSPSSLCWVYLGQQLLQLNNEFVSVNLDKLLDRQVLSDLLLDDGPPVLDTLKLRRVGWLEERLNIPGLHVLQAVWAVMGTSVVKAKVDGFISIDGQLLSEL